MENNKIIKYVSLENRLIFYKNNSNNSDEEDEEYSDLVVIPKRHSQEES